MTTGTAIRVSVTPRIAANADAMGQLREGLAEAEATANHHPHFAALSEDERDHAGGAWERAVVDEAVAEIAPAVAAMLEQAIAKRLPWTWEPE